MAQCNATRSPGPPDRGLAVVLLTIGSIVAGAGAATWTCLDNEFAHIDDTLNFTDNRQYLGWGPSQVAWAWRTRLLGVYQPISWMFLSAQSGAWGLDPHGYHAVSIVLHAANAVALYFLTLSLLGRCLPGFGASPIDRIASAAAALLFAVHPLRAEVVAWTSCQPYLLCALFGQASVLFYLGAHGRTRSRLAGPALFASFGCFWAAMLCKAPAVALPAVLVLLDIYPLRRLGAADGWFRSAEARRAWVEKLPYFAMGIPFMVFAKRIRAMQSMPSFDGPLARIEHAAHSASFYAWKTAWPSGLICHYDLPDRASPASAFFLANLATISAVTALLVLRRHSRPGLLAAWAGYLLLLAPTSGLVVFGNFFAADRYSYLPMMAWAPPMAATLAAVWRSRLRIIKDAVAFGLAVVLLSWIALSREQCRTWHDEESLWRHAVDHAPAPSYILHNNLASVLANRRSDLEEALAHVTEAMRLNPNDVRVLINRAMILSLLKRVDEAVAQCRAAVDQDPGSAFRRIGFAGFLVENGRRNEAIEQFLIALQLDPDSVEARLELARLLVERGQVAEAGRRLQEASRLAAGRPDIRFLLGSALALGNDPEQAAVQFREALRIDPQHTAARAALERLKLKTKSSEVDH